jgi:hypothetical protein
VTRATTHANAAAPSASNPFLLICMPPECLLKLS